MNFNVPIPALQSAFSDVDVRADVDLPASVSISGFHQLNPRVGDHGRLHMDWLGQHPRTAFSASDSALPDAVTTFGWEGHQPGIHR